MEWGWGPVLGRQSRTPSHRTLFTKSEEEVVAEGASGASSAPAAEAVVAAPVGGRGPGSGRSARAREGVLVAVGVTVVGAGDCGGPAPAAPGKRVRSETRAYCDGAGTARTGSRTEKRWWATGRHDVV